jgi:signal transduction histidine kinase
MDRRFPKHPTGSDLIALSELPTLSMKESLYPETLVGTVDPKRVDAIFARYALFSALCVLGFTAYHLVVGQYLAIGSIVNAVVIATIGSAYFGRDVWGAVSARSLMVSAWFVHVGVAMLAHGGLSSPAVVLVPFIPWVASHLLSQRATLIVATVALSLLTVVFGAQLTGRIPDAMEVSEAAFFLRYLYILVAVTGGTLVAVLNVRRRRDSESGLERATERASAMLNALPDTFILLSPTGEILEARVPPDSALVGLGRLINHRIHVMLDPREASRFQSALESVSASRQPETVELQMLLAGATFDIEARVSAHPEGNLVALLRDISLQKRSRRMKDEFVSTVSHELRTPLTSIHGSLALLRNRALGDLSGEAAGVVELAWRNSDRLRRLIDDLLDVQKMESGRLDLRLGQFGVDSLLSAAVQSNQLYAVQYGVELQYQAMTTDVAVRVDDDRFHQVISNLLSNAIKYSPDEGRVVVNAVVRDGQVRISVQDNGRGIPDDFKSRVFETFAQADSSETRLAGGTGLGLSICKRLVTAFGGTIGFESFVGKGTTFWVDLPIVPSTGWVA